MCRSWRHFISNKLVCYLHFSFCSTLQLLQMFRQKLRINYEITTDDRKGTLLLVMMTCPKFSPFSIIKIFHSEEFELDII